MGKTSVFLPLVGKYQINKSTVLSISIFSGSIGDELANLNRWRRQLGLDSVSDIVGAFQSYEWNETTVKTIALNNNRQFMLIFWFVYENKHIFNKVLSNEPISKTYFKEFIEGQSWENI